MAEVISFAAQPRDASMTGRALRRDNKTPGVMYGRAYQATPLQFDSAAATRLVREAGTSRVVSVAIDGSATAQDAFIRDVQRDPVTGNVIHLDLYAVMADQIITNFVPLVTEGRAPVIDTGAMIVQLLDTLEVECLPRDMPASIIVDLTKMVDMHSSITVGDLAIPSGVTVLGDSDRGCRSRGDAHDRSRGRADRRGCCGDSCGGRCGRSCGGRGCCRTGQGRCCTGQGCCTGQSAAPKAAPVAGKATGKPGKGDSKPEAKK